MARQIRVALLLLACSCWARKPVGSHEIGAARAGSVAFSRSCPPSRGRSPRSAGGGAPACFSLPAISEAGAPRPCALPHARCDLQLRLRGGAGGDCVRQARLLLRGGEGEESDGDAFSLGGDSSGHPHKARAAHGGNEPPPPEEDDPFADADAFSIGGASSPRPGEPGGAVGDEDDFSIGNINADLGEDSELPEPPRQKVEDAQEMLRRLGEEESEDNKKTAAFEDLDAEADVIRCNFDRIGDTNGVLYYLGTTLPHQRDRGSAPNGKLAFDNPALAGRVQVKAGPQRCMSQHRFRERMVQAEDVLERRVMNDQFWFPDGFFALDLGNHTTLRPTHYMMRNGGGIAQVTTGWVLEGANFVDGEFWRVGDWQVLDKHVNASYFVDLANDGSAPGYTDITKPPMKFDYRTGRQIPALHDKLAYTFRPQPIGTMPHHTLAFKLPETASAFRFFRLRQLTNYQNTHEGVEVGHKGRAFYLQGFELYGTLRVAVEQSTVPLVPPAVGRGYWLYGIAPEEEWEEHDPHSRLFWAQGPQDQSQGDRDVYNSQEKYKQMLQDMYVTKPPPRTWDEAEGTETYEPEQ